MIKTDSFLFQKDISLDFYLIIFYNKARLLLYFSKGEFDLDSLVTSLQLSSDTKIFTDTLTKDTPYIAKTPRDHESLFFVTKGNLLYQKGSHTAVVRKGQIGYIAGGSVDKSSAFECESVSYIVFNFCFGDKNTSPLLPFDTLASADVLYKYENLFREALNVFMRKSPGYMTVCNGIILQIVGYLYEESKSDGNVIEKAYRIKDSVDYLLNNYGDRNIKISELSKISNMSQKHFRRIFCNLYGKNPSEFLTGIRIEKAKMLLLYTEKNITETALLCGFSDVYSFSHCFKKHTGVSPKNYNLTF